MCGSFANAGKELNTNKVKAGGIRCVEILCIENNKLVWEQNPQPPRPPLPPHDTFPPPPPPPPLLRHWAQKQG